MAFEGLSSRLQNTLNRIKGKGKISEADVKEMWLTHYSPSLIRAEEFMDDVRTIFPRAKANG